MGGIRHGFQKKIEKQCELKWNNFTHSIITCKTGPKSLIHVIKMMECQQAIRPWKLNPVYEEMDSMALMWKKVQIIIHKWENIN